MQRNPWFWIGAAAVGFSVGFPLMKAMLEDGVTVWQILVPRYALGTAVILAIAASRSFEWRSSAAIRSGAVLGAVNVAFPTVLMSIGTDLLPASVAGVLTAFIPLATVAAAHFTVPNERFSAHRIPGLALAAAGVAVLVLAGRAPDGARLSIAGVGITLAGVFLAGLGGALNRRFALEIPATSLVVPQFVASALLVAIMGVPAGGGSLGGLTGAHWIGIVVFALVSTALPFFALLKAGELASAAKASLIGYIVPLLASGLSIVFLGDPLSTAFVAGAALIVSGVYLADRSDRRLAATT